jgi:hypothetical protein
MAFTREKRNAVKIEGWRLSKVPIAAADEVLQGDMMKWDSSSHQAKVASGSSGDAATFIGVAETTNPIPSLGVLTSVLTDPKINILQQGLVEMIAGVAETVYPFDTVTIGADAQTVQKQASGIIGIVDPSVGALGKALSVGDYVLIWLRVPDNYRAFF